GQVQRGPTGPAGVGYPQALGLVLDCRGGAVDPGRAYQRAAEPGGQAEVVQGGGNGGVGRCHAARSLRLFVTQQQRPEESAAVRNGCFMAAARATRLLLGGSGAPVG